MTENVLAIHGAFSSPRIFNYIAHKTKGYKWHFFNYAEKTSGIFDLINEIVSSSPVHVVGHSMGGLIALNLGCQPWVKSISTIATPLGGLDVSILQSYLSRSQFINEISSRSEFINSIRNLNINKPCQHLVSNQGFNPWIYEPNDGVVTIRSQTALSFGKVHYIQANHAEIMMDNTTVELLNAFWKINK